MIDNFYQIQIQVYHYHLSDMFHSHGCCTTVRVKNNNSDFSNQFFRI